VRAWINPAPTINCDMIGRVGAGFIPISAQIRFFVIKLALNSLICKVKENTHHLIANWLLATQPIAAGKPLPQ